jgi:hypothetical protein
VLQVLCPGRQALHEPVADRAGCAACARSPEWPSGPEPIPVTRGSSRTLRVSPIAGTERSKACAQENGSVKSSTTSESCDASARTQRAAKRLRLADRVTTAVPPTALPALLSQCWSEVSLARHGRRGKPIFDRGFDT